MNSLRRSISIALKLLYFFKIITVVEGNIWDMTVSVPEHCLSFYFRVIFGAVLELEFVC